MVKCGQQYVIICSLGVYTHVLNASISMEGGVRGVKGQRNSSEVGRDGVTIPPSNHRQSSRCGWFVISVACKNIWGKDEGTTKQKKIGPR